MKDFTVWLVVFLTAGIVLRFSYQVYKKEISPALSSWLIFLIASSLSLTTYMAAENRDFQSGILNMADSVADFIIVIAIVIWGKTSKMRLEPFEPFYLLAAGGIVLFWSISSNAFVSNILLQGLMCVGYFSTIQKMIAKGKNTESFSVWGLVLFTAIIALYPSIVGGNFLAVLYVGRAIVMVSILIGLMIFYEIKQRIGVSV